MENHELPCKKIKLIEEKEDVPVKEDVHIEEDVVLGEEEDKDPVIDEEEEEEEGGGGGDKDKGIEGEEERIEERGCHDVKDETTSLLLNNVK